MVDFAAEDVLAVVGSVVAVVDFVVVVDFVAVVGLLVVSEPEGIY